jgi:hypothetical protein
MLLMIIILGFASIGGKTFNTAPPAAHNFATSESFKNAAKEPYGYAEAYLNIVFDFGG